MSACVRARLFGKYTVFFGNFIRAGGFLPGGLSGGRGPGLRRSVVRVPRVPAPGFRDSGNLTQWGGLMYVGTNGYSWASTVKDTDGMNLGFGVTWLVSSCPSGHAYGFQLRCLSE